MNHPLLIYIYQYWLLYILAGYKHTGSTDCCSIFYLHYYTFDTSVASIPLLEAIGYNTNYAYHQYRNAMSIDLKAQDSSTCICDNGISGKINGITFSKRCAPEPVGDLLKQKNPSCFLDTYQGGLSCCHHKNILLDI